MIVMKRSIALIAAASLAGCVSVPTTEPHRVPVVPPAAFVAAAPEVPLDRWWTAWGDPALDRLVERALAANQDLRLAADRVRMARAMAAVAESALYPTIAAGGAAWVSGGSGTINGELGQILSAYPGSATGSVGNGQILGLGAAWDPDVFGGRHADRDAARAIVLAASDIAAGMRIMIAADVVENWQQTAGLKRRLALLDQGIASADALIGYVRARMAAGQTDAAALAHAEAARARIAAQRPALVELIAIRQRRLAVLAGDLPEAAVDVPADSGIVIPPAPGGGLPAAVLARRPDVRAAEAGVIAAAAHLKSLESDLKPHFTIVLGDGEGHIGLTGIPGYDGHMAVAGIGGSVPLFNAGRLRARVVGGDAELDAMMAVADRATLGALEDVEAAGSLRHGADLAHGVRETARIAADRQTSVTDALFRAGRRTLGDVLEARLAAIADADSVEQARIAQGSATVQFYRALGGGWDVPPVRKGPSAP